jgi:hypothetical protein
MTASSVDVCCRGDAVAVAGHGNGYPVERTKRNGPQMALALVERPRGLCGVVRNPTSGLFSVALEITRERWREARPAIYPPQLQASEFSWLRDLGAARKTVDQPAMFLRRCRGGIHGCLVWKLEPLSTPATTCPGLPIAPVLDAGRFMPAPLIAGPPIVATRSACKARSA